MATSKDPGIKCLAALTTPKKGRVNVIKKALSSGLLADPAFILPLVNALSDRSSVFADVLADEILPQLGLSLLEPLISGFDELPEPVRYRHLRVIRKLAPDVAKTCAHHSAYATHTKLAVESIETLSGSEADAPLLMELARSRSWERSSSSYRALSGIFGGGVQEFLRDSLIQGNGFPELAIAYHPNASLSSTIGDLLSVRLQPLESGNIPSEPDARHLVSLVESAAGQDCEHFDGILCRCIKIAVNIKGCIEPYATFALDFTEATCEAVATNPVEITQRTLVEQRNHLGGQYQFFAMSAAALLDDIPLFETFESALHNQNIPGRCRGWLCTSRPRPWPCSIVSALEYVINLKRGLKVRGHPLPQQAILIDKIWNEPRWETVLDELAPPKYNKAEQDGGGQPATRPESK
jgi:hypothetical protein